MRRRHDGSPESGAAISPKAASGGKPLRHLLHDVPPVRRLRPESRLAWARGLQAAHAEREGADRGLRCAIGYQVLLGTNSL